MGAYLNPGNDGFARILKSHYVDKTALITQFDSTLDTQYGFVLSSRPRRFGKSYAARALVAFYSAGCDSRELFNGLEVSRHEGWDTHLNQLNVIHLDMSAMIQSAGDAERVVAETTTRLLLELRQEMPGAGTAHLGSGTELQDAILDVRRASGKRFLFVIDEWDAPYRLAPDDTDAQDAYADWLRSIFKNGSFTQEALAGAYMTGILPIKKHANHSAVSSFCEHTMTDPGVYAPYIGFTASEVKELCGTYSLDEKDVRDFYDGYRLRSWKDVYEVYAPYSVMQASIRHRVKSFWPSTEAYESIQPYVDMFLDGLQEKLLDAMSGRDVAIDSDSFQNDMVTIKCADDVLTLLVHLGYLAFDADAMTVRVPNREVHAELVRTMRRSRHPKLRQVMLDSVTLLDRLIALDAEAVASGVAAVHNRECTPLFYNNEQALRAVVKSAFIAATGDYARIEELPGGKGYADVVFLPKRGSFRPALIVELKWGKPVDAAIDQIRDRQYHTSIEGLDVPVLFVGITYDDKTGEHVCKIVEWA